MIPTFHGDSFEHPMRMHRFRSQEETKRDEAWWTSVKAPRRRLEREERLPEVKPSISVPEAVRRRSEARLRSQGGPVLQQGQAWLEHSLDPEHVFNLCSVLLDSNRPVLVISRQAPPRVHQPTTSILNIIVGYQKRHMNKRWNLHLRRFVEKLTTSSQPSNQHVGH